MVTALRWFGYSLLLNVAHAYLVLYIMVNHIPDEKTVVYPKIMMVVIPES